MTQMYLERLDIKKHSVKVKIGLITRGQDCYVQHVATDGLKFIIKMSSTDLIEVYGTMVDKAMSSLALAERNNRKQEKPFSFIVLSDINPEMPKPRKLQLLIERFKDTLPDIAEVLRLDYKTATGKNYNSKTEKTDQLTNDLKRIHPHLKNLFDAQGKPLRGAKTRIAKLLGGKAEGAFFYKRVLPVVEAIQTKHLAA